MELGRSAAIAAIVAVLARVYACGEDASTTTRDPDELRRVRDSVANLAQKFFS
jgi:hypothetical protein